MFKNFDLKNNAANIITCLRIFGAIWLFGLDVSYSYSSLFILVYVLCGFTDVLDGFVARKLNIQSEMGAKLDSISDILFYSITVLKFDVASMLKAYTLRIPVLVNLFVRIVCYLYVGYKNNVLHSRHTAWNKLLGLMVFAYPFLRGIGGEVFHIYLLIGVFIASIGTIDEALYIFN